MNELEFIANVRYLGWICYQMGANLTLHDVEDDRYGISEERLRSLIEGTRVVLEQGEGFTGEDNHNLWMDTKAKQGYTYGEVLDVKKKKHPSMIPYEQLSDVERRKDDMDIIMVKLAKQLYEKIQYS